MKTYLTACLSLALSLALNASVRAQAVTTDPVGFYEVHVNAASDAPLGLGLHRPPALTTTVASVTGNVVALNANLTDHQFVYEDGVQDNRFYLFIKGGMVEGKWYEILDNDGSSVSIDQGASADDVESQGLAPDDAVCVIPFWTLNTLFPDGEGIDASPDPFNPAGLILVYSGPQTGVNIPPDQSFFYHDGSQGPAGWYENGNLGVGVQDDLAMAPDTYIFVRNFGASKQITISGVVPSSKFTAELITSTERQDNLVANPFPIPISLADSKLFESGAVSTSPDPFNPTDLVLLYDSSATGLNHPPAKAYFYHDGSQGPAGWYENGNLGVGLQDTELLIQPGDAIVVRKAGGVVSVVDWTVETPYDVTN